MVCFDTVLEYRCGSLRLLWDFALIFPPFDGHSFVGTMFPQGVSDEKEKNVYSRVQARSRTAA